MVDMGARRHASPEGPSGNGATGCVPARVRLVIPVHGEAPNLGRCVEAIDRSSLCEPAEIVLVDDGYTGDASGMFEDESHRVARTERQGDAGRARNHGAAGFDGDVLVFVDADVIVEEHAIDRLITPLLNGAADATVGAYSDDTDGFNFAQRYKHLYLEHVYSRRRGYLTNQYWTALGAISTAAFRDVGGFESIGGGALGEDTLLGCRLTERGARILSVPAARGKHLKEYSVTGLIRNDFRKGVNSFDLLSSSPRALSGFRHSRPRDMAAVALAGTTVATAVALPSLRRRPSPLAVVPPLTYLLARADLLRALGRGRAHLALGTLGMMLVLDLTRGLCVGVVVGRKAGQRMAARRLRRPRISRSRRNRS